MAVFRSLSIVLILWQFSGSSAKLPHISPNVEELHINEGEPLQISCSGSEELKFHYLATNKSTQTTSPSEVTPTVNSGTYNLTLTRPRTVPGDSGYYGCANSNVEVEPNFYDQTDVKWIYVYVKSTSSWFVSTSKADSYQAIVGRSAVFPCRPTSPQYEVVLTKWFGDKIDIGRLSFDPKVGFTLHNVTSMDHGIYDCTIRKDGEVQKRDYILSVLSRPELNDPNIENIPRNLTVGQSLNVNCSTEIDNAVHYSLTWRAPKPITQDAVTYVKKINRTTNEVITELRIPDVTEEDSGYYTCTISAPGSSIAVSKYVAVRAT